MTPATLCRRQNQTESKRFWIISVSGNPKNPTLLFTHPPRVPPQAVPSLGGNDHSFTLGEKQENAEKHKTNMCTCAYLGRYPDNFICVNDRISNFRPLWGVIDPVGWGGRLMGHDGWPVNLHLSRYRKHSGVGKVANFLLVLFDTKWLSSTLT